MQIIIAPNEILLTCIPEVEDVAAHAPFCSELLKTAQSHPNCVGLAANQVGVELRIFVFCGQVAINPRITARSGETKGIEGCMSLPGVQVEVIRSELVMVTYYNEKGKFVKKALSGLEARVFQHELDHLNGKLISNQLGENDATAH